MLYDTWDSWDEKSLPLEFVLGSFKFQVKKLNVDGEERLGFRIDNDMTLESGTHIGGRPPGKFEGSVEDLIDSNELLADRPLSEVIGLENEFGYKPISILTSRNMQASPASYGGRSLYQTFAWTERYDNCFLSPYLEFHISRPWRDIQRWDNYASMTKHPGVPFP